MTHLRLDRRADARPTDSGGLVISGVAGYLLSIALVSAAGSCSVAGSVPIRDTPSSNLQRKLYQFLEIGSPETRHGVPPYRRLTTTCSEP